MYLDHLKFCVVCINGLMYVCCNECNVVSDECDDPTPCLVQPLGGEVMYFWSICFWGEIGFLNCDVIYTCIVNKQFELLDCYACTVVCVACVRVTVLMV